MAAPPIILPKPFVLLTEVVTSVALLPIQNSPMKTGTVQLVYTTSDRVSIGQTVMYNPKMGVAYLYGSTVYILIDDQYVVGQENPPP